MLYFLSGLPRSGSTVLAAILNQNQNLNVTPTSGLIDVIDSVCQAWETSQTIAASKKSDNEVYHLLKGIVDAKCKESGKTHTIDKSRGWPNPNIMKTMAKVLGETPKIIATVRNVPDCAASFVRVAKPEDTQEFLRSSPLIQHLKGSYVSLNEGYEAAPENFLFVDYDDLMDNPQKEIDRIHKFLGLESFVYNLNAIKLERQHKQKSEDVLGYSHEQFLQPRFWLGEKTVNRPLQAIDMQLAASTMGDFQKGWEIAQQLEKERPWDNRAAYNRGWYEMQRGNLLKGAKLLDRGRIEGVFGNSKPNVPTQIWDGKTKGTVLLYLEGGLGDQIHGVRHVKDITDRGCRAIVCCSGQLAGLFVNMPGVDAVVQHEAIFGVYHDFWLPSMSAIVPLEYEYNNISGKPYLQRPATLPHNGMRIGLRWQGNPRFEHEQHRLFPPEFMFNAVKDYDAEFISLQRDEGAEHKPEWVKKVPLNHWGETQEAIASCDLVITSCTSVAHLSASMGVPTWIITPIMPYYLWALPGNKTVWYDSVRLFRQNQLGHWTAAFDEVKNALFGEQTNLKQIGA
jgi:hypothetical protein